MNFFKKHWLISGITCCIFLMLLAGVYQWFVQWQESAIGIYLWRDGTQIDIYVTDYDAEFDSTLVRVPSQGGLDMEAIESQLMIYPQTTHFYIVNVDYLVVEATWLQLVEDYTQLLLDCMPEGVEVTYVANPTATSHKLVAEYNLELYIWQDETGTAQFHLMDATHRDKTQGEIYGWYDDGTGITQDIHRIGREVSLYAQGTGLTVTALDDTDVDDYLDVLEEYFPQDGEMILEEYVALPGEAIDTPPLVGDTAYLYLWYGEDDSLCYLAMDGDDTPTTQQDFLLGGFPSYSLEEVSQQLQDRSNIARLALILVDDVAYSQGEETRDYLLSILHGDLTTAIFFFDAL